MKLAFILLIFPLFSISVPDNLLSSKNKTIDKTSGIQFKPGNATLINFLGFMDGGPIYTTNGLDSQLNITETLDSVEISPTDQTEQSWEEVFLQKFTAKQKLSVPITSLSTVFFNPKSPGVIKEGTVLYMDTGASMFTVTDDIVNSLQLPRLPATCWFTTASNRNRTYGQFVAVGLHITSEQDARWTIELAACTHPVLTKNLLSKAFLQTMGLCQAFDQFYPVN